MLYLKLIAKLYDNYVDLSVYSDYEIPLTSRRSDAYRILTMVNISVGVRKTAWHYILKNLHLYLANHK